MIVWLCVRSKLYPSFLFILYCICPLPPTTSAFVNICYSLLALLASLIVVYYFHFLEDDSFLFVFMSHAISPEGFAMWNCSVCILVFIIILIFVYPPPSSNTCPFQFHYGDASGYYSLIISSHFILDSVHWTGGSCSCTSFISLSPLCHQCHSRS